MGVDPAHCVYVGDAERDMQAAKAAGMYALVAGFGYLGDDDRADTWYSHGWLHTPLDVITWLDKPARASRKTMEPHEFRLAHHGHCRIGRSRHRLSARHAARGASLTRTQRQIFGSPSQASPQLRDRIARAQCRSAARRARHRCAPPSRARRAWHSMPTAKLSSSWRAKCSGATRPRRATHSRNGKKPSSSWSSR